MKENQISTTNEKPNILRVLNEFIENTGLVDTKISTNSKTGTAVITGNKDGVQFTTTFQSQKNGVIQTNSQFSSNIGKDALIAQVKDLHSQGYKQREIADMLGISQSLVSKYINY